MSGVTDPPFRRLVKKKYGAALVVSEMIASKAMVLKEKENSYINFSSNDYLGLRAHPSVIETSNQFTHQYGAGAGASR